ncbi:MAG: selenide, water dikinase SelD [bacterium]
MSLEDMTHVMRQLPALTNDRVIIGTNSMDDAGVYRIRDDFALICTVDAFAPIVDDPFIFGQIVAANSLSDIYAMGGKPVLVSPLIGFPEAVFNEETIAGMLKGGKEKTDESGAVFLTEQIMYDREIKYGMSVCGTADPKNIITNAGAKAGDKLILTKPLGTSFLSLAVRSGKAPKKLLKEVIQSMILLNKEASLSMADARAHACTDITGFGLIGHACEIAEQSRVSLLFYVNKIPVFPDVQNYAVEEYMDVGSINNKKYLSDNVVCRAAVAAPMMNLLFETQTSGGLLISIAPAAADTLLNKLKKKGSINASIIGEVIPKDDRMIYLT